MSSTKKEGEEEDSGDDEIMDQQQQQQQQGDNNNNLIIVADHTEVTTTDVDDAAAAIVQPYVSWFPWATKFVDPTFEKEYKLYLGTTSYTRVWQVTLMHAGLCVYFSYEYYNSTLDIDDYTLLNPTFWFLLCLILVVVGFQVFARNSKRNEDTTSTTTQLYITVYEIVHALIFYGALLCHSYLRYYVDMNNNNPSHYYSQFLPMNAILSIGYAHLTQPRSRLMVVYCFVVLFSAFAWTFAQDSNNPGLCGILVGVNAVQVVMHFVIHSVCVAIPARNNFIQRHLTLQREQDLESQKRITLGLLKNILPTTIVKKLQTKELWLGNVYERFPFAGVLFADIAGFTAWSSSLDASFVGEVLHSLISALDKLCGKCKVGKVKTVGDAYWAVAGVPDTLERHDLCSRLTKFATTMPSILETVNHEFNVGLGQRVGLHCGPITAGIIGKTKFSYDVWGQTMSTCVELEAKGAAGKVHISNEYRLLITSHPDVAKKYLIKESCIRGFDEATYFVASRKAPKTGLETMSSFRTTTLPSSPPLAPAPVPAPPSEEDNLTASIPGTIPDPSSGAPPQDDEHPILLFRGESMVSTSSSSTATMSVDSGTTLQDLLGDRRDMRNGGNRRAVTKTVVVATSSSKYQQPHHNDDASSEVLDRSILSDDTLDTDGTPRLSTVGSSSDGIAAGSPRSLLFNHLDNRQRRKSSVASWNSHAFDTVSLSSDIAAHSFRRMSQGPRRLSQLSLHGYTPEQLLVHPHVHTRRWHMGFVNPDEEAYYRSTLITQRVDVIANVVLGILLDITMLLVAANYHQDQSIEDHSSALLYVMVALAGVNILLVVWLTCTKNTTHFAVIQLAASLCSSIQYAMQSASSNSFDELMINTLFFYLLLATYILSATKYRFYWGCSVVLVVVQARVFGVNTSTVSSTDVVTTEFVGLLICAAIVAREATSRRGFIDNLKGIGSEQLQREERMASDVLLNAALPVEIAEKLRVDNKQFIYERYPECTVLFAEVVGFDDLLHSQEAINPESMSLARSLNKLFSKFDDLCEVAGVEKIKSIGSVYLAVAGAPQARADHAEAMFSVAVHMRRLAQKMDYELTRDEELRLPLRIGIHCGPLVGGVLGRKNFAFDIFGDTVNTASRLMTSCGPHGVQVSKEVLGALPARVHKKYSWEQQSLSLKGKGMVEAWINVLES